MKIFITGEQKTAFEHLHSTSRDKHIDDRINAVLLISEDCSAVMIEQALRLLKTTLLWTVRTITAPNKGRLC